jgi:hypothetical protein
MVCSRCQQVASDDRSRLKVRAQDGGGNFGHLSTHCSTNHNLG